MVEGSVAECDRNTHIRTSAKLALLSRSPAGITEIRNILQYAVRHPIPDDPSDWMHIVMFLSPEVHKSVTLT